MARIIYKSAAEIARIREAGRVVSTVLAEMREAVAPGVTTGELDAMAFHIIREHGGVPSFVGQRQGHIVYRSAICASVNEEVVHGIPGSRRLNEGDVVSLDVGVRLHGFHADSAITVAVGQVDDETARLLQVTRESLWAGIRAVRHRGRLHDVSRAVQEYVEQRGFSVPKELSGHGVGRQLWEPPAVFNYVDAGHENPPLLEGLVIAIEPMVNAGRAEIGVLDDGWTVVTQDGRPSAHFEHTIAVTKGGCEVLTLGPHDPWPEARRPRDCNHHEAGEDRHERTKL